MAELIMGPAIGALVSMVKEKASSYLLEQYKVMEGMEEQHEILLRKLPAIMDVIVDADEQAAQREGAKAWLRALKKVAYEANEVFDEFEYEALRRKASKASKLAVMVAVKLFPSHKYDDAFRCRMGSKLRKIVQTIEVLVAEMNAFGFKFQPQTHAPMQWRQTDHNIFDPAKIAKRSRGEDNRKVVDILLNKKNNGDLMVVPIVGMGGLGKTTLAQLVYNDPRVQQQFQLSLWVCVSDNFDVDSLAKRVAEAASSNKSVDYQDKSIVESNKKVDSKSPHLQAVDSKSPLDRLQEAVSARRFLLVLDDVWRTGVAFYDKWEKLRASLQHGAIGSAVLITTRDGGVAQAMGTVEPYNLTALEYTFLEEIIRARAFSVQKDQNPELIQMVGEIAKKCVGSPLAATAIGSVLRTKTSKEEWDAVKNKSTICDGKTGILPILKLSYYDLPSHMKECFAFCAVFPKDYEIDVNKMIQLWMANGFIPVEEGVHPETIGKRIFDELASRSFFQDVKHMPNYNRMTCKIHDLMHDVAQSVMQKECVVIGEEPNRMDELLSSTSRHLFLSCKNQDTLLNVSLKKMSPAIQTLLCGDSEVYGPLQHPLKYSSVRALQVCQSKSTFLLKSKHLHHLRYLDLSNSRINALPKDISILYNLQTLNLSNSEINALPEDISILYNLQTLNLSCCYSLWRLPSQMKYMTALRHLHTDECDGLEFMPPGLGQLTSLQTLTYFVLGTGSDCSNLGDVQHLNLSGQLELGQLENVREADAKVAGLINKQELRKVTLWWSRNCRSGNLKDSCYDTVLQGHEPHKRLQALNIRNYPGTTFPKWVFELENMIELCLFDCMEVEALPPVWQLPDLQLLTLSGLRKLKFLCRGDTSYAFPKLKELNLMYLTNFERWWEIDGRQGEEMVFPQLEELRIRGCGKLTALPEAKSFNWAFPQLKVFVLNGNSLKGWGVTERTELEGKEQAPLSTMQLYCCNFLFRSTTLVLWKSFGQLQDLSIHYCDGLVHWPENEFQSLVSLRKLYIQGCSKLTGYAQPRHQPASGRRELLPQLEFLEIFGCESLVEIFDVPTSLKTMKISLCGKLELKFRKQVASSVEIQDEELEESVVIQHRTDIIAPTVVPKQSPTSTELHLTSLEILELCRCHGVSNLLNLPTTLKIIKITRFHGVSNLLNLPTTLKEIEITSCPNIELLSGHLDALQKLTICYCCKWRSLESCSGKLPSLKSLTIRGCPQMKSLPKCLQQRLDNLEEKHIDAPFEGPKLSKPQTWIYAIRRDW